MKTSKKEKMIKEIVKHSSIYNNPEELAKKDINIIKEIYYSCLIPLMEKVKNNKNRLKELALVLIFSIVSPIIFSQQKEILVTIENQNKITGLKTAFPSLEVELAFPESKNASLQNVYSVKADNNVPIENIFKNDAAYVNPEVVEPIELLVDPNDYNAVFATDYALDLIGAKEAWNVTTGDPSVILGVSDSNFDTIHEELINNFIPFANEITHSNYTHGTAVAITVAGNTDNEVGKSSIGNNCKMAFEGLGYNNLLSLANQGVKVINISWASSCSFNAYHQEVINEIHEMGIILVAAAGNGGTCGGPENLVYPSAYENVISVSAIGPHDNHERIIGDPNTTFQHNETVDLVAPGYNVALSIQNNGYTTGNGTSFSAPYVTGTIGLMLSVNPCLTSQEVENILKQTAVNVNGINPKYSGLLGAGRLDAAKAVEMAKNYESISFTSESSYNCENDNFAVSISPSSSSYNSLTIQWEDGSTSWNKSLQGEGDHNFSIIADENCQVEGIVSLTAEDSIFDYPNSLYVDNSNFEIEDKDGDGIITIKGVLVIENGVEYDISNKNIAFSLNNNLGIDNDFPTSGVVIKDNAILNIENTNLSATDNCSPKWEGIEVWGGENNNTPGRLSIKESTITNANTAIKNYSSSNNSSEFSLENYNGGQVNIYNTHFINNQNSIDLKNTDGSIEMQVQNSLFELNDPVLKATHILIENVENIVVIDNDFHGIEGAQIADKGTGIKAINSNLNNSIDDKTYNAFYNLLVGIEVLNNSDETNYVKVIKDEFNGVNRGISVSGAIETKILSNKFNISLGDNNNTSFGVNLINTLNSDVSENTFNSIESNGYNYGSIFKNCIGEEIEFYKNEFTGEFKSASKFENENMEVMADCNSYDIIGENDWELNNSNMSIKPKNFKNINAVNRFSACEKVSLNISLMENSTSLNYTSFTDYNPLCVSSGVEVIDNYEEIVWESHCISKDELDPILGDDDNELQKEFNIYPNPSNGEFKVSISPNTSIQSIQLIDMSGRVVNEMMISATASEVTVNLNDSGIYSVVANYSTGDRSIKRVVISK